MKSIDLSGVLDAVGAGDDIDVIRRSGEMVLQALTDTEATEMTGARRRERTDARTNQRNGTRPRRQSTKAGDVELAIPKLRKGSFCSSVPERRRCIDRALFAVVMAAHVRGVFTRKVDDLMTLLGFDAGISKSEVSRICTELDGDLEAFYPAARSRRVPLRLRRRHPCQRTRPRSGRVTSDRGNRRCRRQRRLLDRVLASLRARGLLGV